MFQLKSKHEAAILGAIIAVMFAVSHYMETTSTKELSANGIMGYWHGYTGLYEMVTFGFPIISVPLIIRFTKKLREAGIQNKWFLRIVRYGLLAYFLKLVLFIVLLMIMTILGVGISV